MATAAPPPENPRLVKTPVPIMFARASAVQVTRPTFRKSPMVREPSEKELSLTSPQSFEIFAQCLSESSASSKKDAL